ncbi:MAG TPA: TolC family protein [Methylibium sp.]|uniref:TolC family protein n=1 Tax=Methylibium sp. TaxID=2067992 RepID=UPI002DBBDE6E|nr:TolC family protein [Methylibium sp.]HEU4460529.1 TolC family protein [Methylibium sp.]
MSLATALQLALEQSHAVRASQLDRGLQRQELAIAETEFEPKYSLGGQIERSAESRSSVSTVAAGSTWRLASGAQVELTRSQVLRGASGGQQALQTVLRVVQPLLKGNASVASLALENARLTDAVNRLQYRQFLSETVAAVVLAYHDAKQVDAQVELAVLSLQQSRQVLEVNEALYRAGRLAQRDLLQAEFDIAQNELALAQERNAADAVKRKLLELLGPVAAMAPTAQLELGEGLPDRDVPDEPEHALLAQAQDSREDLEVAELAVNLARTAITQARNEKLPQVDLVAGVQPVLKPELTDAGVQRSGYGVSIGLRFTATLDRAPLQLQLSRARVGLQKAEWFLQDLRSAVANQVGSALRDLRFAKLQRELAGQALALAEQRLGVELQKLKAGRSTTFELSAAQDALKRAQAVSADAQLAVPRARVQLQRVTGQILAQWVPELLPGSLP